MIKPTINFADFARLDLRIGKIVKATAVKRSLKLIKLTVDLGADYGLKTILAGLKETVKIKDLINKNFIFVANLAPKEIMGEKSEGMILAADYNQQPVLISVDNHLKPGTLVR